MDTVTKRVGLLHIAPERGQVEHNQAVIEHGTVLAANTGAEWIVSGELAVCGYAFAPVVGTEWIEPHPDEWIPRYALLAKQLDVTVFVNHPERESKTDRLFNSMFVIDRAGKIIGTHRKICVTPGSEDWSTAADSVESVLVDGVRVGLLVCAEFYPPGPAARLKELGAEIIISAAAWHPGGMGSGGRVGGPQLRNPAARDRVQQNRCRG